MPISFLYPLCLLPSCFLILLTSLTTLAPASPSHTTNILTYAGINLAGPEFSPSNKPGVLYKDYLYPSASDYAYVVKKGMNIVRLPVLWERVQPTLNDALDATQLNLILNAVEQAKAQKLHIILDIHNYAKHNDELIGSDNVPISAFADLWKRLSLQFANDKAVIFGLMNEPHEITSTTWAKAAQAAINAIRSTGARNLVLVPGTAYSGAHSWLSSYYGIPNGEALLNINDPAKHMTFEVHQYTNENSTGTTGECISTTIGAEKLEAFTNWLRTYHKTGFLGEFATGNNDTCNQALEGMLSYIEENADVWLGLTWWGYNPWFSPNYPFNLYPNSDGSDKPQMSILESHTRKITKIHK
ncbi:glycoside hydrolase family 5 protein [Xylella fastidiosa subsp. multiplex]|uniref:Endoglucanase n=1 Tax=Xylella fastidiosa subsp. multiplex TaxID=644357 RepID=A0A9Q4MK74_XYLFS|nr:glycoside hydrolase family 5 protein [Xylella fastidiosa]ERI60771.1 cellulase [Xylella fastidiosa subsp. multiplex Griffin-1]ACA13105.1 Cellulase [Xylella fastidiosa M12]KAJ4853787.1 glycoside hydrolase family 5 protein [Xylella fastidiosa subsp. multiplex]MBE0267960.1 glycoside hydrolase family 5 protein [Xylella fastidiosa subsp. multiplex]MBE0274543.1 glycoside hydrolase family 5 protein [Xylella fastidiosa subsp. multiplex]